MDLASEWLETQPLSKLPDLLALLARAICPLPLASFPRPLGDKVFYRCIHWEKNPQLCILIGCGFCNGLCHFLDEWQRLHLPVGISAS